MGRLTPQTLFRKNLPAREARNCFWFLLYGRNILPVMFCASTGDTKVRIKGGTKQPNRTPGHSLPPTSTPRAAWHRTASTAAPLPAISCFTQELYSLGWVVIKL